MFAKNLLIFIIPAILLSGCGVQSIPRSLNDLDASWSEVQNQYTRRSDLIPNLVDVVKGYAKNEKETLEGVIEARAKATAITLDSKDITPEKLKAFQAAQGQLSQALGKLMVVSEKYPDSKIFDTFRDLQAQLEGTENRITVARQRFIEATKEFNNLILVFPTSLTNTVLFHHQKKPYFEATVEEQKVPEVKL